MNMSPEEKNTGIIYCRVSSHEQVSNTSLEKQERDCRMYAERLGIKIITDPFVEEGESAKTANRTQFQKALSFCAKEKPGYFIVYKLDRFARNTEDHLVTRTYLKKFGTRLLSVTEALDQSPSGQLQETILSAFAEFDNNVRAERSKGGMVEKVRKGIWVWIAPTGYRRLSKGGNLVVDEDEASYVRLAFEEYAKGTHGFESLAAHLHDRGFRSRQGKKVRKQSIEKLIRNPVYYGVIRAFGEDNKAAFEALIEEELFWRCQPGTKSKFHSGKRYKQNPAFPLRRFVVCSECGVSLTGSASTGRKGVRYPYYHHQKQNCSQAISISKATLESQFERFLERVSPSGKFIESIKAIVRDVWQTNYMKLDAENNRLRKEIESLELERQRIFSLHRARVYSDEEFKSQKEYVNLLIQQKNIYLEDNRLEEFNMEEALSFCFDLIGNSARTWKGLEEQPAQRLRFQNQVFPEKLPMTVKNLEPREWL